MMKFLMLLAVFFLGSCTHVQASYPEEVDDYIKVADSCQYLSGEWDSTLPKERQKTLEREIAEVCPKAQKQQQQLREKYQHQKMLLDVINGYDF